MNSTVLLGQKSGYLFSKSVQIAVITAMAFACPANSAKAGSQDVFLRSQDGKLEVKVIVTPEERLAYSVMVDNSPVLEKSPLGLTVDGVDLGMGAKITGEPKKRRIDETYSIFGNHSQALNRANEVDIPMETSGRKFAIIVRAYNDGTAVRYMLPANAKEISGESTAWILPKGVGKIAWMELSQCYEGLSHVSTLSEIPTNKTVMGPLTVEMPGYYLSISEADNENFSDMAFLRNGNTLAADFPFSPKGWRIKRRTNEARPGVLDGTHGGKPASPWRTMIVARDLTGIVNSDLLTSLCPPPAAGTDFSWVAPGRSMWAWWSIDTPAYDDHVNWINAAATLKWEYYLVDWGWEKWSKPGKDCWAMMKELVDYAKSKGVKMAAWVHSKDIRDARIRRAYLEKIKACGLAGIKIDFHPDPTADYMQWYMGALQDCAELKLMVNFHGSVKPSGLRRTYPNDITREAVRGDEYHMSKYHRVMPLYQDESLPFTRALAGPADVTPVMLNPKELKTAGFTWAHEFSQAIVFQSSVTHFADHYKFYVDSPLADLFREIPVVWDETRVLPCTEMGEIVAYARRKGDTWWIGVMNGERGRDVKIPMGFLKHAAHGYLIYDHPTTDAAVDRREQTISPADVLTIKLRPAGGFVAKLSGP